jgi:hypothetical protein
MVGVVVSNVVEWLVWLSLMWLIMGWRIDWVVEPKRIKLVFAASPLSTQPLRSKSQDWD